MTERREPRLRFLSEADCERIHQATLHLLARLGVRFLPEAAVTVFREAGLEVADSVL
jgi:trimethylamine:corrinoid methyltransferase-like protein